MMNNKAPTASYCIANAAGKILRSGFCPTGETPPLNEGETLYNFLADPRSKYIVAGAAIARPQMPIALSKVAVAADGTDTATITGIPEGADLFIDGQRATVMDGTYHFSTANVGSHPLSVQLWPNQDFNAMILATTP